jgi:methylase of polypeptide subunit release factors
VVALRGDRISPPSAWGGKIGIVIETLKRIRARFEQAAYTVAGVRELLGPVAGGALAREEIGPALRATGGGSPLETLIRLFWLQVPVAPVAALTDDLVAAELAEWVDGEIRATVRIEPLEWVSGGSDAGYVVSDLKVRAGSAAPVRLDHVVGAGGASANLAQLVVHRAVDNALDLGTGSGVQALQLAGRARHICATDVNPRALELAELSFALSGLDGVELKQGSLFEPVRGRTFDLIVSNPPFVVSPDGRFAYRESGLSGDEICRRLVADAPAQLIDGGWCQLLANWLHVGGRPWQERIGEWLAVSGCDAWAVQRDVQDPAEYAEMWLRDSCEAGTPEYRERYDAWLDHFEQQGVTGIGFGWISLHRSGADHPTVRVEDVRHGVQQPVGGYVDKIFRGLRDARDFSTGFSTDRSAGLLRTVAGVVQEQIGPPGAPDPERIVLRQTQGLRRAAGVGTIEAALAGVCDGTLPLEPLLGAIAQLLELPVDDVRAHACAVLPELIADGFFEVCG